MPLIHPDLVLTAVPDYRGWREVCAPRWRGKFNFLDIWEGIGVTQQCWNQWGKPKHATGDIAVMPLHTSAYMQLLDGAHPVYRVALHTQFPNRAERNMLPRIFPPLSTADDDEFDAMIIEHDITHDELWEAFAFDRTNKRHTVKSLGRNPVRLAVMLLMAGIHPYVQAVRRTSVNDQGRS